MVWPRKNRATGNKPTSSFAGPRNSTPRMRMRAQRPISLRRELAVQHERDARTAFAKQDLDGAIRNWDRVLELEPGNDTARLEKQKAVKLKNTIENLE